MVETSEDRLEALITILDYNLKDRLADALKQCGIPAAFLLHGSGTAKSAIYDILGYGVRKDCLHQPPNAWNGGSVSGTAQSYD